MSFVLQLKNNINESHWSGIEDEKLYVLAHIWWYFLRDSMKLVWFVINLSVSFLNKLKESMYNQHTIGMCSYRHFRRLGEIP